MGKVLSQPSLGDTTHAVVPIETRVPRPPHTPLSPNISNPQRAR